MLLKFLEQLGVTFEMDWDDEVIIEVPEDLEAADVMNAIKSEPFGKDLSESVVYRAKASRAVFVGGMLNGKRTGWIGLRQWFANHVKRGRWEVYERVNDGRAFFRGYATSQAKAKRGEINELTKPASKGG